MSIRSTATKTFKRKIPILWWTKKVSHLLFITRELTSIAVAYFAIVILMLVNALSKGEQAYFEFLQLMASPLMMAVNILTIIGIFFHSITWFNLAPKAMVIKLGKNKVPGVLIALANYVGWLVISVAVVWLLLN
jgi:fumarate reductase subunit C